MLRNNKREIKYINNKWVIPQVSLGRVQEVIHIITSLWLR